MMKSRPRNFDPDLQEQRDVKEGSALGLANVILSIAELINETISKDQCARWNKSHTHILLGAKGQEAMGKGRKSEGKNSTDTALGECRIPIIEPLDDGSTGKAAIDLPSREMELVGAGYGKRG